MVKIIDKTEKLCTFYKMDKKKKERKGDKHTNVSVISGSGRGVDEICALLGYYAE
jgi:hypothetical protein